MKKETWWGSRTAVVKPDRTPLPPSPHYGFYKLNIFLFLTDQRKDTFLLEGFILRRDEVITLQPFVLLSLFKCGGNTSLASIILTAPALSCQKIHWRLSSAFLLMHSEGMWCYVIVWKHLSSPPHPLSCSSSLPNIFLHLQRQTKPSRICCVLVAKFISTVDGAHSGITPWLPKTIKPCRLKWCCTAHHHNLERPSLAEGRESRGPQSHRCADSAPCWDHLKKRMDM